MDRQITDILIERFREKDTESRLDKEQFQSLFREAVRDYYPKLREKYAGQSIYGISFEIGGVVQKVYAESFETYIYFNTEEMYQENSKDCEEEEKSFYRFEAWAEWDVVQAESPLFKKVQEYLQQNSLEMCCSVADGENGLEEEAAAWYREEELALEEAFEEECGEIRMWMAEVLGGLRKEGFWEKEGNAGLYVLPFGGECDIETEELIETYHMMDLGCHGKEYLDYLKENDTF